MMLTKQQLLTKSTPFYLLWNEVKNNQPVPIEHNKVGEYCFIVQGVIPSFSNIFSYIRNGESDYICMDCITEKMTARGILFTPGHCQLVTSDECYFVGDLEGDAEIDIDNVAISATQLSALLGEDSPVLISRLCLTERGKGSYASLESILQLNGEEYEEPF